MGSKFKGYVVHVFHPSLDMSETQSSERDGCFGVISSARHYNSFCHTQTLYCVVIAPSGRSEQETVAGNVNLPHAT
jgi:hypothetical protein